MLLSSFALANKSRGVMEEEIGRVQPTFRELLEEELRLDPRQWEAGAGKWGEERTASSSPSKEHGSVLEIDCLVSKTSEELRCMIVLD